MPIYMYSNSIGAGIYHNASLGLISASSDGINRITIRDKNLGASNVFNYGDTLNANNVGNYFQFGNNYGFPIDGSFSLDSSVPNLTGYGPGNYYNSSLFCPYQSYPNTDTLQSGWNLRGYNSNSITAKQGPCSDGFHIPTDSEFSSLRNILTGLGLSRTAEECGRYLKMPLGGIIAMYSDTSSKLPEELDVEGYFATCRQSSLTSVPYYNMNTVGTSPLRETIRYCNHASNIRPFANKRSVPNASRIVLFQP